MGSRDSLRHPCQLLRPLQEGCGVSLMILSLLLHCGRIPVEFGDEITCAAEGEQSVEF